MLKLLKVLLVNSENCYKYEHILFYAIKLRTIHMYFFKMLPTTNSHKQPITPFINHITLSIYKLMEDLINYLKFKF